MCRFGGGIGTVGNEAWGQVSEDSTSSWAVSLGSGPDKVYSCSGDSLGISYRLVGVKVVSYNIFFLFYEKKDISIKLT